MSYIVQVFPLVAPGIYYQSSPFKPYSLLSCIYPSFLHESCVYMPLSITYTKKRSYNGLIFKRAHIRFIFLDSLPYRQALTNFQAHNNVSLIVYFFIIILTKITESKPIICLAIEDATESIIHTMV